MMRAGSPTKTMTITSSAVPSSVLLIDDDDMIAGCLREYLVMRGCAVDAAPDFSAAETLMRKRSYRVIVVDPYLTGGVQRESSAVIDAICRLQPEAAVIVLTGYDSPALARIAADCHVAALLTKPQSITTLSRLIEAAGSPHAADIPVPLTRSTSTSKDQP
jgi:ActR/RegA family two-component response regulator